MELYTALVHSSGLALALGLRPDKLERLTPHRLLYALARTQKLDDFTKRNTHRRVKGWHEADQRKEKRR